MEPPSVFPWTIFNGNDPGDVDSEKMIGLGRAASDEALGGRRNYRRVSVTTMVGDTTAAFGNVLTFLSCRL